MKKMSFIVLLLLLSLLVNGQVVDWNDFNERKMDTVMFNVMNSYRSQEFGDYLVWSKVVQDEIVWKNYDYIKQNSHMDVLTLHNSEWLKNPIDLPQNIKEKIIEENINPLFLESHILPNGYNKDIWYGTFDYGEIIVSIPQNTCETYQQIANHAIHSWTTSPGHALHMNANYQKKVIVGTITHFCKETHRVFISFVYVS